MTESPQSPSVGPNHYTLSGDGVSVTISTSGIDGRPSVMYQDAERSETFYGEGVTFEQTTLGTMATVVVARTVDLGDTTFSVLLPAVGTSSSTSHPLDTIGITTGHSTPLGGTAGAEGQLTSYAVTTLSGTASLVQF